MHQATSAIHRILVAETENRCLSLSTRISVYLENKKLDDPAGRKYDHQIGTSVFGSAAIYIPTGKKNNINETKEN